MAGAQPSATVYGESMDADVEGADMSNLDPTLTEIDLNQARVREITGLENMTGMYGGGGGGGKRGGEREREGEGGGERENAPFF